MEEGRVCALNWLDEELASVQPKVIVALGSVALKYLMGEGARITKDRGRSGERPGMLSFSHF